MKAADTRKEKKANSSWGDKKLKARWKHHKYTYDNWPLLEHLRFYQQPHVGKK